MGIRPPLGSASTNRRPYAPLFPPAAGLGPSDAIQEHGTTRFMGRLCGKAHDDDTEHH